MVPGSKSVTAAKPVCDLLTQSSLCRLPDQSRNQVFNSSGTSAEKVLTEKFTRVSFDTVNYEFTVEDPATFTDKFTAIVPMTKVAGQLYEYACHEGNYGMENILRGARVEERDSGEAGL